MKKIISVFILLIMFGCFTRAHPIALYKKTSTSNKIIHQCSTPILYMIRYDVPTHIKDATIKSFNYYNGLRDTDLFFYMGETDWYPEDLMAGNIVIIMFEKFKRTDDENTIAYVDTHPRESGCIKQTSMYIYEDILSATENNLQSILRHEIGHTLGWKHTYFPGELMYGIIDIPNRFDNIKELSEWELKAFNTYYKYK